MTENVHGFCESWCIRKYFLALFLVSFSFSCINHQICEHFLANTMTIDNYESFLLQTIPDIRYILIKNLIPVGHSKHCPDEANDTP